MNLRGKGHPCFILVSVAPGLGRSTEAIDFIRQYKEGGFAEGGSVLIFLSRLEEVYTYIYGAKLDVSNFAIVCGDKRLKLMGRGMSDADNARIVFTTQQIFMLYNDGRSFADMEQYHFKGKPRTLRIWDESLVPADPYKVRLDELNGIAAKVRPTMPAQVDVLDDFLKGVEVDAILPVPAALRAAIDPILNAADPLGLPDEQVKALERLRALVGTDVLVTVENLSGTMLVGAGRRIPDDLAPLYILDGSGSVRGTYDLWAKHGKKLQQLFRANGTYENLTVHVHRMGSGRSTLAKAEPRAKALQIAVDLINADEDEWLLIHHAEPRASIADELRDLVSNPARVQSIHWGNHHGSNRYRHIKKVLVLGLLTYSVSGYFALYKAASGLPWADMTDAEMHLLKRGELKHNLVQAISRCNIRNMDCDGGCGKADVYLIASADHDPESLVSETFAGAEVLSWTPIIPELTGNAKKVVDAILAAFSAAGVTNVTKKSVRESIGLQEGNFGKTLARPDVIRSLAEQGLGLERRRIVRL